MNINPAAKTVLCYGDSNTWGQTPDKTGDRFPANVRWPGVLQSALGGNYYVIEEGLSSRTTNLEYYKKPGRNGRTYLEPCLDSHMPLDYVILMLGTNDFKTEYNRSAEEIARVTKGLVELIQNKTAEHKGVPAKVILVSPILVDDKAPKHKEWYIGHYDERAAGKSKALAGYLEKVAQATDCHFVDAAQVARAGEDGIHLDEQSHQALGELLSERLQKMP